jgi:hypothetical protein
MSVRISVMGSEEKSKGLVLCMISFREALSSSNYIFWNDTKLSELLTCKEAVGAVPDMLCRK